MDVYNILKKIKKVSPFVKNQHLFKLSDVPAEYKSLVKKIMKSAPVWGSHQTIRFPDGFLLRGGRDLSRIDLFRLPLDLHPYTVLDLGCNIGAIAIECKKRNARRVVGLDKDKNLIECAIEISKLFHLEIEYKMLDITRDEITEHFDYVFLLNVFHHLDEGVKIKVLRNIDKITAKKLFFESATRDDLITKTSMTVEDYLSYLRGFTSFTHITLLGYSDFNRPVLICER